MSDLFSWLSSYLNLAKLTAVTVPGMVVAFALILVLGPIPCRNGDKSCPFCPATLKPATPRDSSASNPSTAGVPALWAHTSPDSISQTEIETVNNALKADDDSFGESPLNKLPKAKIPLLANETNSACRQVPSYLIANGISVISPGDDEKKQTDDAQKKGQGIKRVSDLVDQSGHLQQTGLLSNLDACNNELQIVSADLNVQASVLAKLTSQATLDLTSLSANLISERQLGESLVVDRIQHDIDEKRRFLNAVQQATQANTNASSAANTLQGRITSEISVLEAAPTAPAATTNPAVDVFQSITQNLLKFLLFSLLVGQIFDPIQRGIISFVGPRRNMFAAFNRVYGQFGDGEFRYGDRRLSPWVDDDGKIAEPDPKLLKQIADLRADLAAAEQSDDHLAIAQRRAKLTTAEAQADHVFAKLQDNVAAKVFKSDRNVYDKSYAVGAGYITNAEATAIDTEFYVQSQITSGLMIPMLILSICLAIRVSCCSQKTWDLARTGSDIVISLSSITEGLFIGILLTLLILLLGSRRYAELASALRSTIVETVETNLFHAIVSCTAFLGLVVLCSFGLWFQRDPGKQLDYYMPWLIMAPSCFIAPLWVAGLDRLHKYYSELQARIAGNLLRLETNIEQKMVDLIEDPDGASRLKDKLEKTVKNHNKVLDFLRQFSKSQSSGTQTANDTQQGSVPSDSPGTP